MCEKLSQSVPDDEEPTNRALLLIVSKMGNWKNPARGLGLEESEIDAIEIDHWGDVRHKMLSKWSQNRGTRATWRALVRGICLAKDVKLANHVIDICKYCMAGVKSLQL